MQTQPHVSIYNDGDFYQALLLDFIEVFVRPQHVRLRFWVGETITACLHRLRHQAALMPKKARARLISRLDFGWITRKQSNIDICFAIAQEG